MAAPKRVESAWNEAEAILCPFSIAADSSRGSVAVHDAMNTSMIAILHNPIA